MRVNRLDVRLALALCCVLTCLYWLTTGAHIDSTDGETAYLVAEGLVERGTFVQLEPDQVGDSPRALVRGRIGNLYAITGAVLPGRELGGAIFSSAVLYFFHTLFCGLF